MFQLMPEAKLPFLAARGLDLQEGVIKKLAGKCRSELRHLLGDYLAIEDDPAGDHGLTGDGVADGGNDNQPRVSLQCAFHEFGESDNTLAGAYPWNHRGQSGRRWNGCLALSQKAWAYLLHAFEMSLINLMPRLTGPICQSCSL